MQQPVFHLEQPATTDPVPKGARLLVQLGDHFTGFLAYSAGQQQVHQWVVLAGSTDPNEDLATQWEKRSGNALHWLNNAAFEKVQIISYTARSTAVPAGLANGLDTGLLTELMLGNRKEEIRLQDTVSEQLLTRYYTCNSNLHQALNQRFPGAVWQHVQSCLMQQEPSALPRLHLSVYFNQVLITAEANQQWLLSQTYDYHIPEDLLYYTLACMEELQLDVTTTPVLVDGFLELQSPLASILQQYVAQLQFEQQTRYQFPESSLQEQIHTTALADRILSCVS